ncbi:sugar phosphate isomerase/epimerase family protein [Cohnella fermenti]|uniref:Sugar phosphate isomerase/epimerase n=1 Tax=Cohnella fermenti TaxID=2565925 RepID=A0A4S4C315_9BACL|nr:sugar phosphate isomerase/epimerase [Cohnella fermenti]THF82115.1 sugar phosphate isomerase/epimerase [Cohnella fermenti]
MKLSVFTVSTPDLTPEELAAAAKEAGLDGIEWRYKDVPSDALEESPSFWRNNRCSIPENGREATWKPFKEAADAHKLVSLSVTPYLTVGDLECTEQVLAAAKYVGAKFIRLAVPWYDGTQSFSNLLEKEMAYLREAQELCKNYGVKGLVETHHKTIAASASGAYRLVEAFDPDWIGVLFDPGNMVHEGFENYKMGLELLGPYLAHVHVKNAAWNRTGQSADGSSTWNADWVALTEGIVPWSKVVGDLKAVGYEGYLGVEDFSISNSKGSREMLRNFAEYIGSLI